MANSSFYGENDSGADISGALTVVSALTATATAAAASATASELAAEAAAVSTAADALATAADAVATAADVVTTNADAITTSDNAADTAADALATAADRVQTGLDRVATAADRVQTGLDRVATAADALSADADAATATAAAATLTTALGAQYLVGAAATGLTAERVVTDTATVSWDLGTAGQAKASVVPDSIGPSQLTAAVEAMLLPPGAVLPFAMNTAPTGWLKANGAAVSRATYAALFAAISTTFGVGDGSTTFNLPDMRGYFARGWVDDGTVDSSRTFGSTQADAMQGHRHSNTVSPGSLTTASGATLGVGNAGNLGADSFGTITIGNPTTDTVNGTPRTANETRPSNVALLYCIKV